MFGRRFLVSDQSGAISTTFAATMQRSGNVSLHVVEEEKDKSATFLR
jgi:hypothetical protein